jgi:hypothetical protein
MAQQTKALTTRRKMIFFKGCILSAALARDRLTVLCVALDLIGFQQVSHGLAAISGQR